MKQAWPKVKLGDVLRRSTQTIAPDAATEYREITVRLWGKGVVERGLATGSSLTGRRFVARAGQFIASRIDARNGAMGLVPSSLDGGLVTNDFPLFYVDETRLLPNYLGWLCRTQDFVELCLRASEGTTNRVRLKEERFHALAITLPPLPEQRRIVARIEELAAKIAEARSLRQQAAEEAEALLKASLCRFGEEMRASGTLGDILSGRPRNGWSARCDNADDGTAILSLSAVTGFRYRRTAFKRTSLYAAADGHFWLRPGDILITRSNTPDLVGHAAIYDGEPAPCIYPDLMMRLELQDSGPEARFVWYWLQSPIVREFIRQRAKGTSPTMKKISQATVMAIPFPDTVCPSEQRRIVAYLDGFQLQVDALKRLQAETAAELDALLPAILDRAFRGEL